MVSRELGTQPLRSQTETARQRLSALRLVVNDQQIEEKLEALSACFVLVSRKKLCSMIQRFTDENIMSRIGATSRKTSTNYKGLYWPSQFEKICRMRVMWSSCFFAGVCPARLS